MHLLQTYPDPYCAPAVHPEIIALVSYDVAFPWSTVISVNFTSSLHVLLFSILLLLIMLWALEISETTKSIGTIVIHMCVQCRTRHGCFSWFCTEIHVRSCLLAKTCVFHWLKAVLMNTCWCNLSSLRCTKPVHGSFLWGFLQSSRLISPLQ